MGLPDPRIGRALGEVARRSTFPHLPRAVFRTPVRRTAPPNTRPFGRRKAEGPRMTTSSWITMLVVIGFVWGGFSLVLLTAIRKETGKQSDG